MSTVPSVSAPALSTSTKASILSQPFPGKGRIAQPEQMDDLLKKSYLLAAVVAGIIAGVILSVVIISLTVHRVYKSNHGSYSVPLLKPSIAENE
ncbi:unnamed protein product [Oikopleura dioica]|uniref:Syndecan/Neurexin domain-containing protein n=1 Tax=Oikopleura dioica TaxID=34765 RepID=E4XXH6_OIKDI|nr:unnamed protein product [Oikopleura dioica]CBY41974.1 unnamed protein product [Oikopleura dioica]